MYCTEIKHIPASTETQLSQAIKPVRTLLPNIFSHKEDNSHMKKLLYLVLVVLVIYIFLCLIGVVWFGPRWPTYEITYTLRRYLLKIGVPLAAIVVTLSVFVTIVIGICTYLFFSGT